jgi:triacylglycerol esterase/lipase EstA (alpha/beta hydrolase family)
MNMFCAGYEWHHPIVLIGHSFGGLVLKSMVVKLKRASTIRNPTNSCSRKYGACVELGKLLFFKHCIGAQRYMAIFKERSSFGAQCGKFLT